MSRNRYDVDEVLERKLDFSKLKRINLYLKPHVKEMVLALFFVAAASLLELIIPTLLQIVIDEIIPMGESGLPKLLTISIIAVVVIIISSVFTTLRNVLMVKIGQEIIYSIRGDLFRHLQELPFSYYDSRPHGKILVRVISYVNSVSDTMTNGIINALVDILNIIFITIFMFRMNVLLSLYVLAGLPILIFITILLKNFQKKANFQMSNKSSNLTAYTCEALAGTKETEIFSRQDENMRIFKKLNKAYHKAWMRYALAANYLTPLTEIMKQVALGIVYIAGVLWITDSYGNPTIEVGVIIAMGTYCGKFWQPFINLANIYSNFLRTLTYLERIFETMDEPVEIKDRPNAITLDAMQGEVEFKNLDFAYEKDQYILQNFNLKVKAGESVALVGETGSGKSTIVSLISRFYPVKDGSLFVDGVDINDISIHSLRSNMGVMLQDSFIFSGTIADNIRYGKLDATDEEVKAAAKAVCADEFISQMPNGYNTVVTERGGVLSQGQKQLISFARTLLSNPAILILDEATSSIDAKTERLLQKGIETLLKGRTSFIIAHRLSTIRHCDCIYYLEKGKIQEFGTHEVLFAKNGKYHHLCTVQSNE